MSHEPLLGDPGPVTVPLLSSLPRASKRADAKRREAARSGATVSGRAWLRPCYVPMSALQDERPKKGLVSGRLIYLYIHYYIYIYIIYYFLQRKRMAELGRINEKAEDLGLKELCVPWKSSSTLFCDILKLK